MADQHRRRQRPAAARSRGRWPEQACVGGAARLPACSRYDGLGARPGRMPRSDAAGSAATRGLELGRAARGAARAGDRRAGPGGAAGAAGTRDAGGPPRGEFDRPLYAAHELGYAVSLTGRTVAASPPPIRGPGSRGCSAAAVAATSSVRSRAARADRRGHLDRHSVWLQNSVRAAVGLALAVLMPACVGAAEGLLDRARRVVGAAVRTRCPPAPPGAAALAGHRCRVRDRRRAGGRASAPSPAVLWSLLPMRVPGRRRSPRR